MYFKLNHTYNYQVVTTIQIFYPNIKFKNLDQHEYESGEFLFESLIEGEKVIARLTKNGECIAEKRENIIDGDEKYFVKKSLFLMLKEHMAVEPSWGMLTGIRPAKKVVELIETGMNIEDIPRYLEEKFYVNSEKSKLAIKVALVEKEIISKNEDDEYSLYIGIPFCKTRCTYCSFTSYPHDTYKKNGKLDVYIENLVKEIRMLKDFDKDFKLKNVYFGGGTPTSITAEYLDLILKTVSETFDLSEIDEYTVEAGRADTIDEEKLKIIKSYGVTRLSINAQTMNDDTLKAINRSHSSEDFINVFNLAREIGFDNINVDVIVGLPDETTSQIADTMAKIVELNPENITIHTLSYKRGTDLTKTLQISDVKSYNHISDMLNLAKNIVEEMGYKPYYLYRQKNMAGQANAENIGYCKDDKYGIYNIQIMEEKQHILGCGAGVNTKIIFKEENRLERFFNLKTVE